MRELPYYLVNEIVLVCIGKSTLRLTGIASVAVLVVVASIVVSRLIGITRLAVRVIGVIGNSIVAVKNPKALKIRYIFSPGIAWDDEDRLYMRIILGLRTQVKGNFGEVGTFWDD